MAYLTEPSRTECELLPNCYLLPNRTECRVNGIRRLAIVGRKQMRIDLKRDRRAGMSESLRYCDNIDPCRDELAGVCVPQGMKCDFWHADAFGQLAPKRRYSDCAERLAL